MTIYVGNLSFQAEREDLLDLFGQYGNGVLPQYFWLV
mgnify:CR=1 FL=1